jgi:tetratricopeptide (TPR) repeat protein
VRAYREKKRWSPEWISDIHAAYTVLLHHPLGTDLHVVAHYDFMNWIGATPAAIAALDDGLARFPDSWILHDRLRARLLEDKGPDGLEATYAARLEKEDAPAGLEWFAGYASLVAAEAHRRAKHPELAVPAYDRARSHYEKYVVAFPANKDNANHYLALALAGRGRIALERGDLDAATADILASFKQKPSAAASLDGLNISPVDTAKMLRAKIVESKRDELLQQLQAALDELDPKLLELPAYEREVSGPSERPRRNGPR